MSRKINHLVVVVAPSGAGKSTLVDEMRDGSLPAEIRAQFPAGAETWMRVKHGKYREWLPQILERHSGEPLDVILEYDMTSRRAAEGFEADPALDVLKEADQITVINIRPPTQRLINQISHRDGGAGSKENVRRKKLSWAAGYYVRSTAFSGLRSVANALPAPVVDRIKKRDAAVSIWGALKKKGLFVKVGRYEQPGWLEGVYERWQVHLSSIATRGVTVRQTFLEPDPAGLVGGGPRWRVKSSGDKPSAALSTDDLRNLTSYSRLPPRLERDFPQVAAAQSYDKYGNAERLSAILETLADRKIDTVIDLGGNAGYFCLSLLDATIAKRAIVYDVFSEGLAAGRMMAKQMGLQDRIEFIEQPLSLDFLKTLPEVDMMICLNFLHHAGIKFDQEAVARDGFEFYTSTWLAEMRCKAQLAVLGMGFEEKKPVNWDAPQALRPARFARMMERSGWSLLYDANVRDIEKLGLEAANGRYTRGGVKFRPLPNKKTPLQKRVASIGRVAHIQSIPNAIDNKRQKYHIYIAEAQKASLPHLVVVAGVSGAGKSLFVEQLMAGELPYDIMKRLPADIRTWPSIGSSMAPELPSDAPGAVIEYDMNGRGLAGRRDFADDPTLTMVTRARAVTVVNLRPAADVLVSQLLAREGGGRSEAEVLAEKFMFASPPGPVLKTLLRPWSPWKRNGARSLQRKVERYRQAGWLESFYGRWQSFIEQMVRQGTAIEQLFLEPASRSESADHYSWRLSVEPDRNATEQADSQLAQRRM